VNSAPSLQATRCSSSSPLKSSARAKPVKSDSPARDVALDGDLSRGAARTGEFDPDKLTETVVAEFDE
jgi:hypothetical protein